MEAKVTEVEWKQVGNVWVSKFGMVTQLVGKLGWAAFPPESEGEHFWKLATKELAMAKLVQEGLKSGIV